MAPRARAASKPGLYAPIDEHLLVAVSDAPTGLPAGEAVFLRGGYRRHVRHRLGPPTENALLRANSLK